jgi:hypothetical protein
MRTLTLYILLIFLAGCSNSWIEIENTNIADGSIIDSSTNRTNENSNQSEEYKDYKIAKEKLESLIVFNDDFISIYKECLSLKQKFGNTNDTNVIIELNKLKEYVILPYKLQDLKEIETKYLDTLNDMELRERIYVELFEKSISSDDIEDVILYDRILQANNFKIVDENFLNRSEQIKNIHAELIELENKSLPDDEYLFNKATIYSKLNFLGRWMECHVLDVTSSTYYYKKLIKKYPNSKYILDAQLVILGYAKDYISNNTEPYNYFVYDNGMAMLEKYEYLLEQTDNIEQRSKIYFVIAEKSSSCEMCFEDSTAIATTKKYLDKIVLENPDFDKIDKVREMLTNLEK